jgi:nucleotide-binding universal stress UspA family protein
MKLLIAVDSTISTEVLLGAIGVRPWPDGTTAHVLSVVADADVPEELWREEGYGKRAVQREMETRGEQIAALSVERLREIGIRGEVVVTRGDARFLIPFYARKWSSDLIFVRAHVRKDYAHWMLGSGPEQSSRPRLAPFRLCETQEKTTPKLLIAAGECCSPPMVRKLRLRQPALWPGDRGPKAAKSGS